MPLENRKRYTVFPHSTSKDAAGVLHVNYRDSSANFLYYPFYSPSIQTVLRGTRVYDVFTALEPHLLSLLQDAGLSSFVSMPCSLALLLLIGLMFARSL